MEDIKEDEFHAISSSLPHVSSNKAIRVNMVLIDSLGREFELVVAASGVRTSKLGVYYNLSLSPNRDKGKFYYPKDAEFVAMKIRANVDIVVEHLSWYARFYYQSPDDQWSDVNKSEVIAPRSY